MATVDKLLLEISANTKGLEASLKRIESNLGKTEKATKKANNSLNTMRNVLLAIGGTAVLGKMVSTIRKFEDFEATLRAVTGSAQNANNAFALIRVFTATTTFQLDEVTGAFIKLKQAGITPTSDVLRDFGNLAAGMGRSIETLAQAAFNATTGEMEMLKQFGVVARLEGDTIRATFDGTTTEIERSGDAIVQYLRDVSSSNFSDAIEQRAKTLTGAISNLEDSISEVFMAVGEGGLKTALTDLSKLMTEISGNSKGMAQNLGFVLGGAVNMLTATIKVLVENINLVIASLAYLVGSAVAGAILSVLPKLTAAFKELKKVLQGTLAVSVFLQGATGVGLIKVAAGLTAAGIALATVNKQIADFESETGESGTVDELDELLNTGMARNKKAVDLVTKSVQDLSKAIKELPKGKFNIFDVFRDARNQTPNFDFGQNIEESFTKEFLTGQLGNQNPGRILNQTVAKMVNQMIDGVDFANVDFSGLKVGADQFMIALLSNLKVAFKNVGLDEDAYMGFLQDFNDDLKEEFGKFAHEIPLEEQVKFLFKRLSDAFASERDSFYSELFPGMDKQFFENFMEPLLGIEGLEGTFAEVDKIAKENRIGDLFKDLEGIVADPDKLNAYIKLARSLGMFMGDTDAEVKQALKDYITVGKEAEEVDPFAGLEGLDKFVVDALDNAINGTDALKKKFSDLEESELDALLDRVSDALVALGIDADQAKVMLAGLDDISDDLTSTLSDELAQSIQSLSLSFTNDFVDALMTGQDALESFEQFADQIVKQIIAIFLQLAVVNKILNAIFGQGTFDEIQVNDAGKMEVVKATQAGGGRVHQGNPTLVGERGPELFIPHSAGSIMNNHGLNQLGGSGVTVVQHLNITTGVQSTVRAEIMGLMPEITNASKQAVQEAAQRGGTFKRSFR